MKKAIKNVILTACDCWELTPYEVVKCFLQAIAFVSITALSIRPFCWAVVKIAELIGRI